MALPELPYSQWPLTWPHLADAWRLNGTSSVDNEIVVDKVDFKKKKAVITNSACKKKI